jgi:hypothetical protein
MDVRKKTLNIDQARLDRARRLLRADTDTDTIHAALDRVIEGEAIVAAMRSVAGKGKGLFRAPPRRPAARRRA